MEAMLMLENGFEWIQANVGFVILGTLVVVQWVAFQALLVHYHLYRKSQKKPRNDGIRFSMIERNLKFHAEQIEMIFEKLAELKKEMGDWAIQDLQRGGQRESKPAQATGGLSSSVESSFVSLGEINLKRRIAALRTPESTSTQTH
jgi:hypothetical protein